MMRLLCAMQRSLRPLSLSLCFLSLGIKEFTESRESKVLLEATEKKEGKEREGKNLIADSCSAVDNGARHIQLSLYLNRETQKVKAAVQFLLTDPRHCGGLARIHSPRWLSSAPCRAS
jgi:ribosomal protein L2